MTFLNLNGFSSLDELYGVGNAKTFDRMDTMQDVYNAYIDMGDLECAAQIAAQHPDEVTPIEQVGI